MGTYKAKHSNGKQNWSLSKGVIAGVIGLALIVAFGVFWVQQRDQSDAEKSQAKQECFEGDLELPIFASAGPDSPEAKGVIDRYKATNPQAADHCIQPVQVPSIDQAAVVLTALPDAEATAYLGTSGRKAATEQWPIAMSQKVGVAVREGAEAPSTWEQVAAQHPAIPSANPTLAGAVAAAALTKDDRNSAQALVQGGRDLTVQSAVEQQQPYIALGESDMPKDGAGYRFVAPRQITVALRTIPLTTGGKANEDQSRAATNFAEFLKNTVPQNQPDQNKGKAETIKAGAAVYEQITKTKAQHAPGQAAATDTLVVAGTGQDMMEALGKKSLAPLGEALTHAIPKSLSAGAQVGLTTYPSPLADAPGGAAIFPFGGVTSGDQLTAAIGEGNPDAPAPAKPTTRATAVAAMKAAAEHAQQTGKPARVLLVTAGSGDSMSDDELNKELGSIASQNVSLALVHVAGKPSDHLLTAWARDHGSARIAKSPEDLTVQLDQSLEG